MPKIFKPRIGSNLSQKVPKIEFTATPQALETTIMPPSEQEVKVPEKLSVACCEEPKEALESKSVAADELRDENEKPDNVDIDDTISEISVSFEEDSSFPSTLFRRRPHRTTKRRTKNEKDLEPPPPPDQPLDRAKFTMRSLINWVPVNKPPPKVRELPIGVGQVETVPQIVELPKISPTVPSERPLDVPVIDAKQDLKGVDYDPFAPQLCLDADGNLILDEKSLEIKRPDAMQGEPMRHVAEHCGLYSTTYASFRRPFSSSGSHWSEKDTIHFYRALSTIGTDFYCMTKLFPNRSREQLLRKFKREERQFPHLVNDALKNKREYDVTALYESSDEEKYSDLAREIIATRRKNRVKRGRKTSNSVNTKKPYRVIQAEQISAIIDCVLNANTGADAVVEVGPTSPVVAFLGPAGAMSVERVAEHALPDKGKQPLLNTMINHMEGKPGSSKGNETDGSSMYSQYKETVIRLSPINNLSSCCSDPSDMLDRVLTKLNA